MNETWQQGKVLEVAIADLGSTGDGVGRWQDRVVFVPNTVPGDRVSVRLLRVKPEYAQGQLLEVLTASPERIRPRCIVADKCGGCQWQAVAYQGQLKAKHNQVIQSLERIGGFQGVRVDPILAAAGDLAYRNKATYPLARSAQGQVQAGYYRQGSHQLINLNQCPVQDPQLNPLLAEIKQDLQQQGWSIYNEAQHRGRLRHLSLRMGRRTREMLLTLVVKDRSLAGIEPQAQTWMNRYPNLVGVALNHNPDRTNAIFGPETRCVAGRAYLHEVFAGLTFQIQPTTFFQIHTEQAEILLQTVAAHLNLQGHEVLVDAYCGVGAFTLPLAKNVRQAIGIESQPTAVEQAQLNARLNHVQQATFYAGTVETVLPTLSVQPDVVLLDPPRKGCDPTVLRALLTIQPERIVYVSCNPATLARDLKTLCREGNYQLTRVQPIDFFPQTPHVECAAFLVR
ncbi:MAG: 23S rRNA (uracil(1939)-C(5))-methyltransferase RlmD [Cyanothece sp. SIO1E1]|nr:23S rRNA (uracil(1939)-C(5))-methyltransferase RlmD [Cyanothece sp. SIO1E1]